MDNKSKSVPLFVDYRRWYGLSGHRPLFRCLSCGGPLGLMEIEDLGDHYFRHSCGQVFDVRPFDVVRSPTHKTSSRLCPDGRVIRRRIPLSDADSQLDLFGGVQ